MTSLTRAELAAIARADVLAYTLAVSPWYSVGDMHHLLADELMRFERACTAGESPRLVIEAPPRHGKSLLLSRHFPAWLLGRHPDWETIFATYAQELADEHGRFVRNLIASPDHAAIFPDCRLAADSSSVRRFVLKGSASGKEGAYAAAGVGGPLTGRGARALIIDDPIKGREEADSPLQRAKQHAWYDDVAQSRVMDGGGVCITATRWHEKDLTGYVLEQYAADGWRVVKLPALAEGDDPLGRPFDAPLWPAKWPADRLQRIRATVPARTWASLYQQRPVAEGGLFFEIDKVREYARAPERLVIIGGTDSAVTEGGGDFTEHGVIGIDARGEWFVLDWWSGQTGAGAWTEAQVDLMEKWRPALWLGERGVIQLATEALLRRRMQDRRVACRLEWLASSTDKAARARGLQGMVSMGWLHLPAGRPFTQRIRDQLLAFPAGVYDDCVDVLSLIARGQTQFGRAILPAARARPTEPTLPPGVLPARWLDTPDKPRGSRYKA